jgi:hypothetical protein
MHAYLRFCTLIRTVSPVVPLYQIKPYAHVRIHICTHAYLRFCTLIPFLFAQSVQSSLCIKSSTRRANSIFTSPSLCVIAPPLMILSGEYPRLDLCVQSFSPCACIQRTKIHVCIFVHVCCGTSICVCGVWWPAPVCISLVSRCPGTVLS